MEWKLNIQQILNWLEYNLDRELTLEKISSYIGYSEFHTTRKFRTLTGETLRKYIQLRRLSNAAIDLRDTDTKIINIAMLYEFSSQEAFTKSFRDAFGITPRKYREERIPLNLKLKKNLATPEFRRGEIVMDLKNQIEVKKIQLGKHKFAFLEKEGVDNYMDFWRQMEKEGIDCDKMHGYMASLPGLYKEPFGIKINQGNGHKYKFGVAIPLDYKHDLDKRLIIEEVPESSYLLFEHPLFLEEDFSNAVVNTRKFKAEYDPSVLGVEYDTGDIDYIEHSGLTDNYYFLRVPIK